VAVATVAANLEVAAEMEERMVMGVDTLVALVVLQVENEAVVDMARVTLEEEVMARA